MTRRHEETKKVGDGVHNSESMAVNQECGGIRRSFVRISPNRE